MTAPAASLASLKCEDHADTQAMRAAIESMVYWEDIKADEAWTSPYMKANDAKGAGKRVRRIRRVLHAHAHTFLLVLILPNPNPNPV